MTDFLIRKTRDRLWLVLAIPLLFSLLAFWSRLRYQEIVSQVLHTKTAVAELEALSSDLKDAETGQRGFVITGEDRYLEPYRNALNRINARFVDLKRLLAADPGRVAQLEAMSPPIQAKLAELAESIELRRQRGFEPAAALVRTDRGKREMDDLRRRISALEEEISRALDAQMEQQRRTNTQVNVMYLAGTALTAVLLTSTLAMVRRYSEQREQAENALKELNATLEYRIQERTAELHHANEELQHFAYAASHDLQEPLRMIVSYTQLLEREYADRFDEEGRQYITYAVQGALRMSGLLKGLRDYWQATGHLSSEPVPVDTEAAFCTALDNLHAAIREHNAQVTHETLPRVAAHEVPMVQLFQNLIGNAIKYHGPQPPHVHVAAERVNGHWRFSVRDNGIGIAPENLEQVFGLFKRVSGQKRPGAGIGLALCQKIIQRYGGRIWVDSQPGQGATFFFTLPAKEMIHE